MPRIAYVNGRYQRYAEAGVHVEDRGFQFADAVYEVIEVRGGALIDEKRHLDRLERSLAALDIAAPMARGPLAHVLRRTILLNRVADGTIYLQVSRGASERDFLYHGHGLTPTLVCIARRLDPAKLAAQAEAGIAVKTVPEMRWARRDIKTVMLLPAVLAKEMARGEGAKEAWFVDHEGFVIEGASSNAWMVDGEGRIVTRPLGPDLLPGVTRATVIDVAHAEGIPVVERAFTVAEVMAAPEAFNTAATAIVMPVVRIDGRAVGDGRPGPLTCRLRSVFHKYAARSGT